jgi:hypothetical protein
MRWQSLLAPAPHPAASLLGNTSGQTWYLIDRYQTQRGAYYWHDEVLLLHAARRTRRKDGEFGKPTAVGKPPEGTRPEGVEGLLWAMARGTGSGYAAVGGELALEALEALC